MRNTATVAALLVVLAGAVSGCTSRLDGIDLGPVDAGEDGSSISCIGNQSPSSCPSGMFCETPPGICGSTEPVGTCVQVSSCTTVSVPVCGCTGKTYQNDCFRQVDNVGKAYDGACGTQLGRVADGTWGGAHIQLTVSPTGGNAQLDCNRGTVDEPLTFWDSSGHFSTRGTYDYQVGTGQHGTYAALYAGVVDPTGVTMTLVVTWFDLDNIRHELGPYSLAYGAAGTLSICQ